MHTLHVSPKGFCSVPRFHGSSGDQARRTVLSRFHGHSEVDHCLQYLQRLALYEAPSAALAGAAGAGSSAADNPDFGIAHQAKLN